MNENKHDFIEYYQLRPSFIERMIAIVKQRENAIKGGVVFFGDSITELCDLDTYYPNIPVKYNCGIHGLTTTTLLLFIDEGVILYEPSKVVILAGTNDLGRTEMASPRSIALNIQTMVKMIHHYLPETIVYIVSPLPCQEDMQQQPCMRTNRNLKLIFTQCKEIIDDSNVEFVDIFDCIANDDFVDGLHIQPSGYKKMTKIIEEALLK